MVDFEVVVPKPVVVKKKPSFVRWFVPVIVMVVAMHGIMVIEHELVHGAVCKSVGGTPVYSVSWYYASTGCVGGDFSVVLSDFRKYNLINEIIGYNLFALVGVLILFPVYKRLIVR